MTPHLHLQVFKPLRICVMALAVCAVLPARPSYAFDAAGSPAAGVPAAGVPAAGVPVQAVGTVQAAFAPWDNVEALILDSIALARKQVLVQAYILSSKALASALVKAARRGVDVRVLADAEQHIKVETSKLAELADAGVPVWLESTYQAAHNKIMIIDANTAHPLVITGSYNFTWSAQHKNAENILVLRDNPALAARYALNWERHRQDASPYRK